MNNRQLTGLLLVCMMIAAILGYLVSTSFVAPMLVGPDLPRFVRPPDVVEFFAILKTIISFVNVALILFILGVYINIYRTMRTRFTLSLVTVMLLLLLYAVTSNPLLHVGFGFQAVGLGPFAIIPDIFTTVALLILFYLSLE